MGRTKKVKFDTNNIFFRNQHSQSDKAKFLQSPLFPVFASAYNSTKNAIRVGLFKSTYDPNRYNTQWQVSLVTEHGFSVGALSATIYDDAGRSSFGFNYPNSALSDLMNDPSNRILTTGNPRYLQSKLAANSNHDAATQLRNGVDRAYNTPAAGIRRLVDSYIDSRYGSTLSSSPTITMGDEVTTCIANIVMGKISLNDLPAKIRNQFDNAYRAYEERKQKFSKAVASAADYVCGDKFLFFPNQNGGVVLAAINGDHIKAALTEYEISGELPSTVDFNYLKYTLLPEWYPDINSIPDQYRGELEYSLTMLKVNRNSPDLIPQRDGYSHRHWADVGCGMYNDSGVMLMLQR